MISFEPFGRFTGHFEASGPHRYVDSVWRACEVSEKVEGTAVLESDLLSCKYTREPTCAVQNFIMLEIHESKEARHRQQLCPTA